MFAQEELIERRHVVKFDGLSLAEIL